jgi:energy-coupling factor transporter ATP-binding protein EcfA2
MSSDAIFLNAGFVTGTTDLPLGAQSVLPSNPFVGLRPFESEESILFFGRDKQIIELMQQLHRTRFLAVVGSSGCGKSSLIRAGLIPKLKAGFLIERRDVWNVVITKPGDAPLTNMASALLAATSESPSDEEVAMLVSAMRINGAAAVVERLAGSLEQNGANLLLLVDQFEELFRYADSSPVDDPMAPGRDTEREEEANSVAEEKKREQAAKKALGRDEAMRFVSIMLELARQRDVPVYVVLTMRSDFLGECDSFRGLPEVITQCIYLVPRLDRQQRQEAGENPVRLYGQAITARLLDRVVNDVGDEPDQLPVMQHALMRTWEEWKHDHVKSEGIDLRHYEAAGTFAGALSKDADDALAEMQPGEQLIAERMFQVLVDTDSQGRRVRRPAHLSEIAEVTNATSPQLLAVVDYFRRGGRCFLTLSSERAEDDPLLDISHESFIRQWDKLSDWINAENESKEQYSRLATAALRYRAGIAALWTNPELSSALKWWDERGPTEPWARRYNPAFQLASEFLKKSEEQREKDEAAKEQQRLNELKSENIRRQNARLRRFTFALVVLAVLASFGVFAAALSMEKARKSEALAIVEGTIARKASAALEKAAMDLRQSLLASELAKADAQRQKEIAEDEEKRADAQAQIAIKEASAAKKAREDLRIASTNQLKIIEQKRRELLGTLGGLYQQAISLSGDDETADQSISKFQQILDIYDKDDVRAGKLSTLLLLAKKLGDPDNPDEDEIRKALEYYERSLPLFDTSNKSDKQSKIDTLIQMGDLLLGSLDDNKSAVARYEQALQEGYEPDAGDSRQVYLKLGDIYASGKTRDEWKKAIEYYDKEKSLLNKKLALADENPDDDLDSDTLNKAKLDVLIKTAPLRFHLNQKVQGRELVQEAIEFARTDGNSALDLNDVLIGVGSLLDQSGEERDAELYFDQYIQNAKQKNDPEALTLAYYNIGRRVYGRKNYDEALRYLRLAPPSRPSANGLVVRTMGDAYKAKGLKKEALDHYKLALAIYAQVKAPDVRVKTAIRNLDRLIKEIERGKSNP